MGLSRQTRCALEVALALARRPAAPPSSGAELAKALGIDAAEIEGALRGLAEAGLLVGDGARPAYRLSRAPGEISVVEIVEAFEPLSGSADLASGAESHPCCPDQVHDPVEREIAERADAARSGLRAVTLATLSETEPRRRRGHETPS